MTIDRKGNISSEIVIVLLIILLIIGLTISITTKTNEKLERTITEDNIEKLTSETIDNLINNPGNPVDWEKYPVNKNTIPGLAIINEEDEVIPNSLSFEKFLKLGENYDILINKKIFSDIYESSIFLEPLNKKINSIIFGSDLLNKNHFQITRTVECDFFNRYKLIDFETIKTVCNKNHDIHFKCNFFSCDFNELKNYDYYIITNDVFINNDTYWAVDNTENINNNEELIKNEAIYLNPILKNQFNESSNKIFFIHFTKENIKSVLIKVPKNFNKNYLHYEYFKIQECKLSLMLKFK